MKRVVPVRMMIDGEMTTIGEALIETDQGDCMIAHAIIDDDPRIAELLKTDLHYFSVGTREDFPKSAVKK